MKPPVVIPGPPPTPIVTEPTPLILPEVGDCHLYDWYPSLDTVFELSELSVEQQLFHHYDFDGDCRISREEFYYWVPTLQPGESFADFDLSGDTVLNYAEFDAYVKWALSELYEDNNDDKFDSGENDDDSGVALSPFHLADSDKDGYVSVSEAWLQFGTADINAEVHFTAFKLELEGCDMNDDNVLDEDEFEHFWSTDPVCDQTPLYRYIFDLMDTDEDKNVSKAEFNSALLTYGGEVLSEVELQEKMGKFDTDGNGTWSYGEFEGWFNSTRYEYENENIDYDSEDDYDYVSESFKDIDSDGDGFVSASEFWEKYGYGDLETGINLIKADWAGCDTNDDEVLDENEFENYWNSECSSNDEHEDGEDNSDHALKIFKKVDSDEDGFVSASELFEDMGFADLDDEEQINLIVLEWKKEGCDENDDGLLNEEEFVNYWNFECPSSDEYEDLSPFELADSDEDGYVSVSEAWFKFGSASNNTEAHFTAFKLELEGCDLNNDKVLDEDEFENLWNGDPACDKDPLHRYLYGLTDADHDKTVTKTELNSALLAYGGEVMSEAELQEEFGKFDTDGNSTWSYREFVGWLNATRYEGVNETVDYGEHDNVGGGNEDFDQEYDEKYDEDDSEDSDKEDSDDEAEDNYDYEDYVLEIFEDIDSDGDGFVSAHEIFVDMGLGDSYDEEEIQNQINKIKSEWKEDGCDENGDELLNEDEFGNYWSFECPLSDDIHHDEEYDNGNEDDGEDAIVFQ